jgi:hypothetical protein
LVSYREGARGNVEAVPFRPLEKISVLSIDSTTQFSTLIHTPIRAPNEMPAA